MFHDLDLLLLGKTGNGKSSTANTILGCCDHFECDGKFTSVTKNVQDAYSEVNKRVIKIVDAPGIMDTDYKNDMEKATKDIIDKMKDAVLKHTTGYHAFLIVLKYSNKFTPEDALVIKILKQIFGDTIVKDYCILVLTYGDIYRSNRKNRDKSFKTWCSEQQGVFAELYKECGERAVLFDNQTDDKIIIEKQMKKMLTTIDNRAEDIAMTTSRLPKKNVKE